ncbi:phage holin family protein [Rickettsiella endosymbiont of Rhagonycha lignosa]|uniref:phage holin family protein n=1 Tax=Rickettsiella endosymbiont of Rhagonycha lignosa TaxID=3077937 RepID=UPI00313EC3BB
MKKYRIKKIDASTLNGLRGLHIAPFCEHYSEVFVLDDNVFSHFNACREISLLPKSSDTGLVCAILNEMQRGNATSETVTTLKKYLQYTEKKDKNSEIKSGLKQAIKQIFFGLALVVAAVAGCVLMLLLIGLYPVNTSWISLLIIPIVAVAAYGIINSLVGVVQFGFGIFSFCFRHNNKGQLLELENALHRFCLSPPPSYREVMDNMPPTAPVCYSELPTYQQAMKNGATFSTPVNTSTVYPSIRTSLEHSAHFFPPPSYTATNNRATNLDSRVFCNFMRT